MTLTELYEQKFPPQEAIIDNLLVSGTYLLAGSPKVGKSYFMVQLLYPISHGLPFLGRSVHKSEVLYLALEDNFQRLQERFSLLFEVETTDNLHLAVACEALGSGLEKQLLYFIEENPKTKLVVTDTVQLIREQISESASYSADYSFICQVKIL